MKRTLFLLLVFALTAGPVHGRGKVTVREYLKEYVTYSYSEPDPVPQFGKLWPYFKFRKCSSVPEKRQWKIVELESDYLVVRIMPEIGGKIWSVTDKSTGKEMFYDNETVKFRNVALRGPWTSGGIEFNFGIIGHAPSCSSPVDYLTRTNEDGSASCFIGNLDLVTRTYWNVEINLPADRSLLCLRFLWHNRTGFSQPYYNWSNAGVEASDDLEFIFPGDRYIGHDGRGWAWPDGPEGRDLSKWRNNDFGTSKSYHIVGSRQSWFAAYRAQEDFGVVKYSLRDDKVGAKIWIWALSDEGNIWADLLSDSNRQYIEIQSGRLFNQNQTASTRTPFKQIDFEPYRTDVWTEYWFPFSGTGGVSSASPLGVLHATESETGLKLSFWPVSDISDELSLWDEKGELIRKTRVALKAAGKAEFEFSLPAGTVLSAVKLGGQEVWRKHGTVLHRPATVTEDFDNNSAGGHYFLGRDLRGFARYEDAQEQIRKVLEVDSGFIPALVEMARLKYWRMDYASAFEYASKALSIDTYCAPANYEYAQAALMLGREEDALDGFEIAALTGEYRSAAYTELTRCHLRKGDLEKALHYAGRALAGNRENIEALQLLYLCFSLRADEKDCSRVSEQIVALEPLNPFIRFERYLKLGDSRLPTGFADSLRSEFPIQTFLELGIWYEKAGQRDRAVKVLEAGPPHALSAYWIAFLGKDDRSPSETASMLEKAAALDASFVFPFRTESTTMLAWALQQTSDWQPRYYLALIECARGNPGRAASLVEEITAEVRFAPFWAFRAALSEEAGRKESCLKKAIEVSGGEPLFSYLLARHYFENAEHDRAKKQIEPLYKANKDSSFGLLYVRALLETDGFKAAEKVLSEIDVLPSEGNTDARLLYRRTKLSLAVQSIGSGKLKQAERYVSEARLWPRNLGSGKPYEEILDTRLEDELSAIINGTDSDPSKLEEIQRAIDALGRKEHTALF